MMNAPTPADRAVLAASLAVWLAAGDSQQPPSGDRAIGPGKPGPGTPKGPKRPQDTTDEGDAKDGSGEDNHQQRERH